MTDIVERLRAECDMWRAENVKKQAACEQMGARIVALEAEREAARREGIEAALRGCRAAAMAKIHGSTYHQVATMLEDDIRALLTEGGR